MGQKFSTLFETILARRSHVGLLQFQTHREDSKFSHLLNLGNYGYDLLTKLENGSEINSRKIKVESILAYLIRIFDIKNVRLKIDPDIIR